METRTQKIEKALIKKLNGNDCCELTLKKSGELVLLKHQGKDPFYAERRENWYLGQPSKSGTWVITETLFEMAAWIEKWC